MGLWLGLGAVVMVRPCVVTDGVALHAMRQAQVRPIHVNGACVNTSFLRREVKGSSRPSVLFLHGADSSYLEWRLLLPLLTATKVDCLAVDWITGGWTDRRPFIDNPLASKEPWTLIRQHLKCFMEEVIGPEPIILVGTSLGGAVAIDFAHSYPNRIRGLILIDSGGESYKAPPPQVVRALAPAVLAIKGLVAAITCILPNEKARIAGLHRSQPGWLAATGAYLASGSYAVRVNRDLIQELAVPTLVVWGSDDPILPIDDAFAFQKDLGKNCVAVREVAGGGHSPHLDEPDVVAGYILNFVNSVG